MNATQNLQIMNLQVTEELSVNVLPNTEHEFLMTTKEVAHAYGVSPQNIREHQRCNDDLIEKKHFVKGISFSDTLGKNAQPHQVFWSKRGVVRLGFFIKSARAKLFRDWAEDLVINAIDNADNFLQPVPFLQAPKKRNHNRLTQGRLLDIMVSINKIENTAIRQEITQKLGL